MSDVGTAAATGAVAGEEHALLHGLFIEDDPEFLGAIQGLLPRNVSGHPIVWETCEDFDEALKRLAGRRYDLVITDVYRGDLGFGDAAGGSIVDAIRERRFAPIVAVSSGAPPEELTTTFFVRFADKTKGEAFIADVAQHLKELLDTGLVRIIREIHDEIDRVGSSYVWGLLEERWDELRNGALSDEQVLSRVVRRRAAVQLGRLAAGGDQERGVVEGAEYYLWPPVSGSEHRLGEILRCQATQELRILLTPHCHLTVQPGADSPKAKMVLTAKVTPAVDVFADMRAKSGGKSPWKGDPQQKLRQRITCPPGALGEPAGRYWFLPGFLEIPNAYCDLMQLESLPLDTLNSDYDSLATLDAPFAEALQSSFVRFYAAVGTPTLAPERFAEMIDDS